jgi:transposase
MYVRKVKGERATFFQIGQKVKGKFVLMKHVGSASTPEQIEVLQLKAQGELERMKLDRQPSLFPVVHTETRATLTNWRITGFHLVFGHVYDVIGFPKNNILRDLVVARIAYPKSKLATVRYLDQYLGISLSEDKIYRFLDTLNKDELTKIAFNFVSKKNNGIALIFYDVTTLYFEANNEDDLRKKGFSKDHKNELPQIVIGLFVDKDGYPFDFDFYEGSTFEGHTFPKAIKSLIGKYQFTDLVVVADAGMLSERNIRFLETEKLNYIVGARLKGLSEKFKEKIFIHDFTKESIFETICGIKLETGEIVDKRLIIDFSEKRARKDKFNREKLIKKLEEKIASKKELIKKSKYLLLKNQGKVAGIDQEKIKQDKRHDGLKGYWTNLKDKTKPKEIIDQYHNLWKVEKAFRMSKSDLSERPIFHRLLRRINGHLLICFCSLLILKETERILEPTNISLIKAIEMLGKVGEGEMVLGKLRLPIDSELSKEAKSIFHEVLGH